MRNIILAVVVVVALTAAGVGGTLAGFSDSEISQDNVIVTGALDLKVNGEDDLPWGTGVPVKVDIEHMTPCRVYHKDITVRNDGQCENIPDLFIHFKKFRCSSVPPTHDGYPAPDGSGLKPEPELVAEYGGLVDQVWVEGLGPQGEDCTLSSHISVTIFRDGTEVPVPPELIEIGQDSWPIKLYFLNCVQIPLGKLEPCGVESTISLALHLQQIGPDEELHPTKEAGPDGTPTTPVPDKFKWWKTNALQKDKILFDIEFDLIQQEED